MVRQVRVVRCDGSAGDWAIGLEFCEPVDAFNLWYLNFSDRTACRTTGMTRFATLLVQGGEVVAPLNVMRFDDSMFRVLGQGLLALTKTPELRLESSTYGRRQTGGVSVPGALVDGFTFTLQGRGAGSWSPRPRLLVAPTRYAAAIHSGAPMRLLPLLLVVLLASSCPGRRPVSRADDDDASGGGNPAGPLDVLWVVDNSSSMVGDRAGLAAAFGSFLAALPADSDFQHGVITTDIAAAGNGNQGNLRSDDAVGGAGCQIPRILRSDDPNLAQSFADLVDVGSGGTGDETGLLAAALALCKSQPGIFWDGLPDRSGDDPVRVICGLVPDSERAAGQTLPCNADATGSFVREGATTLVIVLSDEGDGAASHPSMPPTSWLQSCLDDVGPNESECDCRASWFGAFFSSLPQPVVFHTITPTFQPRGIPVDWCDGTQRDLPGPCNEFGSSVCSLKLYQQIACGSGGLFQPIQENVGGITVDDPPQCAAADFDEVLEAIAATVGDPS